MGFRIITLKVIENRTEIIMIRRMAIQLFGHMRTFKEAAPYFFVNLVQPNIRDGYEVDIFIHTWSELDHGTINYRNSEGRHLDPTKVDMMEVKSIYSPKVLLIEDQLNFSDEIIMEQDPGCKRSVNGIYNNSYTNYRVGDLRRIYEEAMDIKYDWVIQTRPDILFKAPMEIDSFFFEIHRWGIKLPENSFYYGHNMFGRFGVSDLKYTASGTDLIFFARPDCMDKATSLFVEFNNFFDRKNFSCMEMMWARFWLKQELLPMPIDYVFARDWLVLYREMADKVGRYASTCLVSK